MLLHVTYRFLLTHACRFLLVFVAFYVSSRVPEDTLPNSASALARRPGTAINLDLPARPPSPTNRYILPARPSPAAEHSFLLLLLVLLDTPHRRVSRSRRPRRIEPKAGQARAASSAAPGWLRERERERKRKRKRARGTTNTNKRVPPRGSSTSTSTSRTSSLRLVQIAPPL